MILSGRVNRVSPIGWFEALAARKVLLHGELKVLLHGEFKVRGRSLTCAFAAIPRPSSASRATIWIVVPRVAVNMRQGLHVEKSLHLPILAALGVGSRPITWMRDRETSSLGLR
jgi:hypothetical protein